MLAYIPAPWILWDRVNHQGPGLIATSRTDAIARVFHGQDLDGKFNPPWKNVENQKAIDIAMFPFTEIGPMMAGWWFQPKPL